MSTNRPASLAAIFVYNPTLGYEFTEVENIIAFYSDFDEHTQKKYVGLMQGIVGFTSYVTTLLVICTLTHIEHISFS